MGRNPFCGIPDFCIICNPARRTDGWETDHVYPASKGGSDNLSNLQPLQRENNRNKGDSTSGNHCKVAA